MELEKQIQKLMNNKKIDLYSSNGIISKKIQSIISIQLGINFDIEEINNYLKNQKNLVEIAKNFFLSKEFLNEKLKGVYEENYYNFFESEFYLTLTDIELENIKRINTEDEITFSQLLEEGIKTGLINKESIEKINFKKENEIFDIYEAIEALEDRGIIVK